jgi:hypothetical protein
MKVANLSPMLGALNNQLVLFSESSQIDLTLTTVYHFLFWGGKYKYPL